ncbi:MAG: hypothetical protein BGO31_00135 [Bacteroidetes bacterium 43-16]|uniref:phage tail assembly protein n=1 Tax=uncultured Dysgonomonas sp. TaxID=206096 RepID=UPI00092A28A7|nr:phage tail assembly protein [uncultured Dysgonomonas sp.]OJV51647.1 MAG: hypothetical protein BGO31_00135 [Bacteroidetes bacterium 43-16]
MSTVSHEVAVKDVENWLSYKRIRPKKIEKYEDFKATLVEAVEDGALVLNEDYSWTHNLSFPIESGDTPINGFKYKPRVTVEEVGQKLKNAGTDADSRLLAYSAALAGVPISVLAKMDTIDSNISNAVAAFFM